jgi:hypothetical protein
MADHPNRKLNSYFARDRDRIRGWFARIDAEIFRVLLNCQTDQHLRGSVAEIGVHHGKAFVGLCLSLQEGERAYCIDVFEKQDLNVDSSGRGDKIILEENLGRFQIDLTRLTIRTASSLDVHARDILRDVGPVRFFSVDGGHWADIVKHDLGLAEASLADHGVVALDDFFRSEWPEVSAGYFSWSAEREKSLKPFCIGFNKLYLCHYPWKQLYQDIILNDDFMQYFSVGVVKFQGIDLPIFNELIAPEYGFIRRHRSLLRQFRPEAYVKLRRIYRAARSAFGK